MGPVGDFSPTKPAKRLKINTIIINTKKATIMPLTLL